MSAFVVESGTPFNITATGLAGGAKAGQLIGFYVNSTTAGTVILRSGGSGGAVLNGVITPAIGFHRFPANYAEGGLHVTVGGTLDVTFFVIPGVG